jgi:hypothetical protein
MPFESAEEVVAALQRLIDQCRESVPAVELVGNLEELRDSIRQNGTGATADELEHARKVVENLSRSIFKNPD